MVSVSILIPCYNAEEYVGKAIESALNQTWPKCEIIVVDDGSEDDSLSAARAYEEEGVLVVGQKNQGASAARNRALEEVEGDYVQFLDADDLLHPRKVEAQLRVLSEAPSGTVAVSPTCYFKDGEVPGSTEVDRECPGFNSKDPVGWLIDLWTPGRGWGMVQTGAWLTPVSLIEQTGSWDESISKDDDGEFFTRVVLVSSEVRCVDETCVYYRKYDGDTTRVGNPQSKEAFCGWLRAINSKRNHLLPKTTDDQRPQAARVLARQYWTLAVNAYPSYQRVAAAAEAQASNLGYSRTLCTISQSGWKGTMAQAVRALLGWRAARWIQHRYHEERERFTKMLRPQR
jgi:glycosyltransferase involved in cell wall biosynthesis